MNNTSPFEEFVKNDETTLSFGIGKAILYSIIAVVVWQIIGGIVTLPAFFYKPLNHVILPLSFIVGTISAIAVLLVLTKTKFKVILEAIKHKFTIIQLVLSIACWFLFLPLAEFCTSLIPTTGPFESLYKIFEESFETMLDYKIAGFIMVCLLAPIFEEIIFRGIILKGMLNFKVNPIVAIALNGFIFGCAHMNPWQFIGAGLLGVIFGFVYYRTKSLFIPMLLHFLNNTLSYTMMLVQGDMEGEVFLKTDYLLLGSLTLLGIISAFLLFRQTEQKTI
jgi:uncharacterized protein